MDIALDAQARGQHDTEDHAEGRDFVETADADAQASQDDQQKNEKHGDEEKQATDLRLKLIPQVQ
ncbi:MAG TPA: hypothetical protein VD863_17280 [Bradyrhizobium sp.]|nr:hypothetical protein [Bradyrhizobium sp.]